MSQGEDHLLEEQPAPRHSDPLEAGRALRLPLHRRTLRRTTPLQLVSAPPRRAAPERSLLTHWHLLSLDAPTVAALWTVFVARSAGISLSPVDAMAMFLAVWMLYAADRLLDARPLAAGIPAAPLQGRHKLHPLEDLEERHWFHHRHRTGFRRCLVAGTLPLAYLLQRLLPSALHLYAILAALLSGWLLLVHAQPLALAGTRRLPKELAVGLFFPAAVFIPTVARAPALQAVLLPGAALFAGVCTLNCLLLYAWEHPGDRSRAHASTRLLLRRLTVFALALAAAAALCTVLSLLTYQNFDSTSLRRLAPIPAACALSVALLLLLHLFRTRFSSLRARALADAALLTPVIFLFIPAASSHR